MAPAGCLLSPTTPHRATPYRTHPSPLHFSHGSSLRFAPLPHVTKLSSIISTGLTEDEETRAVKANAERQTKETTTSILFLATTPCPTSQAREAGDDVYLPVLLPSQEKCIFFVALAESSIIRLILEMGAFA